MQLVDIVQTLLDVIFGDAISVHDASHRIPHLTLVKVCMDRLWNYDTLLRH